MLSCGSGPPADGGVIRNRQREAEQVEDRADRPLGLAQHQTEDGAQHQRRRDRQVGIVRPPSVVRGAALQLSIASSVNPTVRLPRRRRAAYDAAQLVTRRFGRRI
jgi:hypothetical protein